jgi:hypothetical protein
MEGRQGTHQWRLRAPVLGRGELGSFRGGEAEGDPRRWNVAGPILAQLSDGSSIRADHLVWENAQWILAGRPATWTRPRQRLSGPRVVRREEGVHFTAGVAGALAAPEGDLTLRADQGRALKTQVLLEGRVECAGQGWRLQADRISVTLGPGNMVRKVFADGSVVLHGRMGEGRGDSLEMDPSRNSAAWKGRVKALTEVQP